MNHQDSFDFENLVFTPTDSGLQMSPPFPPPLPLVQDFENFDFLGLQMSPPSPPPLPLLPSHMNNTDVAQSAEALNLQGAFELPDFTSTPTDVELVRDHLCPAIQRLPGPAIQRLLGKRSVHDLIIGPAVVNGDLPSMAPWELPGMIARNNKGGMRDKYYLTDHRDLRFFASFDGVRTTNGFWQKLPKHAHGTVIWAGHNGPEGAKTTMKFHQHTGAKTNWIMNVYYSWNEINSFVEDDLFLCHVFETDSPDYDGGPKCLGCQPGACSGNHSGQAFGAPSNASFWPMHHHDTERRSDTMLSSYIAEFENILLGDPDPDNSADTGNSSARRGDPPTDDHGQSKKRKKISDVWDYFTKIFARDIDGNVLTFAACNHCCKILTGSSKGGTTHLARHTCPCKFKPVAAGRSAKDSGGDVSRIVLSS